MLYQTRTYEFCAISNPWEDLKSFEAKRMVIFWATPKRNKLKPETVSQKHSL